MSTPTPNQSFPTAAQAIEQINLWDDLPVQRRRNLVTAVQTLCRVGTRRPPATVRLDPASCLPLIDTASPDALGITPKSHANRRNDLRAILRRLEILAPVRRRIPVTNAAWAGLIAALPARFHPHRLRAFMEFCASLGVAPGGVNNPMLSKYLEQLQASRGGPNVRANVREVARQWNKMREAIPGWPEIELALAPPADLVRALPLEDYPASLQAEIDDFLDWIVRSPEDELDGEDIGREALSPETAKSRKKGVRLLLWGLVETGRSPESIQQLGELAELAVARQTLVWHRKRLGNGKATSGTAVLGDTVQMIAAYVGLKGEPLDKLRRILRGVRPKKQVEITDKLDLLLTRLKQPEVEADLITLPQILMEKARYLRDGWTTSRGVNHPPKPAEACWKAALAAAIEIELVLPLRIHDLSGLRLDTELHVIDMGRGKPREIRLRVVANKNDRIVETILRGEAAGIVTEYLEKFRPLGPNASTHWVFPNRGRPNGPRSKGGFGEAIADTIEEHTGLRVNVHAFRAFAATRILDDNPHALEDVRSVLGHSTFEMIDRHYRRNNRAGAAERISEGLARRRQAVRRGNGGSHVGYR